MPDRIHTGVTARLAFAFVMVALVALALFAFLTVLVESNDLSGLAREQAGDLAKASAAAAAAAYRVHDSWSGADLSDAVAIANAVGGQVVISDRSGSIVDRTPGPGPRAEVAATAHASVVAGSEVVGRVDLSIGPSGVGRADAHLHHVLALGLAGSAAAAILLALGTAVIVADRISRPLRRLTVAARQMAGGQRQVRVGTLTGAKELAELGDSYDAMAAAIEEEDRLRRAVAAHVAHELRTPVAIILAASESFLDGVSEPSAENLASLRDEALRLTARIEDLETLSSAEAAGVSMRRRLVNVADVAEGAARALADRFATARVQLRQDLTPAWVIGDADRLHQVITNLLTNAEKFSPAGATVELAVRAIDNTATVTVSDTGFGIDEEEVPRVFEPFWRGKSGSTVAGSGVGLAVVAELVAAHGGRAEVESSPGTGAVFRIVLPLIEPDTP